VNRDDLERLNLAYRAWKAAAPTEGDIEAGARRVANALAHRPRRRRPSRRVALAAAAVSLVAALAYAASGPVRAVFRGERASSGSTVAAPGQGRVGTLPSPPPRTPALGADATAQTTDEARSAPSSGGSAAAPRTRTAAAGAPSQHPHEARASQAPSWRRVDDALARGDESAAESALGDLELRANDDDTRAKSRLGLAQLALGRHDCDGARRYARAVLTLSGAEPRHLERARAILARCSKDGG
jgi:hypothetical protein